MRILAGKLNIENKENTLKEINDIAEESNSIIVLFDGKIIAGRRHIEESLMHAKRSFQEGTAIARTLAMEILVYASGQRQCSLASKIGLHNGENVVFVLIDGGNETYAGKKIKEKITLIQDPVPDTRNVMKQYDISKEELDVVGVKRIEELVIERVAMIDAWK